MHMKKILLKRIVQQGFSIIMPTYAHINTKENIISSLAKVNDIAMRVANINMINVHPISPINKKEVNRILFRTRQMFTMRAILNHPQSSEKGIL